jgi:hypothetical protein
MIGRMGINAAFLLGAGASRPSLAPAPFEVTPVPS